MPGTVHWRSFFWPPTSTSSALSRFGMSLARSGAGCPTGSADTARRTVCPRWRTRSRSMPSPMASLTATADSSWVVTSSNQDSGSGFAVGNPQVQARKLSAYLLGVGPRWPWYFDFSPAEPYGLVRRGGHLEEADLADLHARVNGDGQVGHVGELQGEVAVPSGVDEPGRRVDQQARAGRGRTCPRAGRPGRPGSVDLFGGRAEDELAGMEDQARSSPMSTSSVRSSWSSWTSMTRLVWLRNSAEVPVDVQIDRRRLDAVVVPAGR